jgi:RNA-binding protein 39
MMYVSANEKAVSLNLHRYTTGQMLRNQVVMVKSSEAEKNVAWEAAQQQKQAEAASLAAGLGAAPAAGLGPAGMMGGMGVGAMGAMGGMMAGMGGMGAVAGGPCKLRVGGLHVNISEGDLRAVFEPFGETDFITIQRLTGGGSLGAGYVQYKQTTHALLAVSQLHGLELVGQALRVSLAPGAATGGAAAAAAAVNAAGLAPPGAGVFAGAAAFAATTNAAGYAAAAAAVRPDTIDEDSGEGGLKMDSRSRAALMARLAGQDASAVMSGGIDPMTGLPITAEAMAAAALPQMPLAAQAITQGVLGPGSPIPTPCLLLKNLFDPLSETEDEWWVEIAEDVKDECGKHGAVAHIHVDRDSQGFVYLKFEATEGSQRAQQALHSRWFAARMIAAEYQFVVLYNAHFGL